jgi:hypothetical protein
MVLVSELAADKPKAQLMKMLSLSDHVREALAV